ncbi:MAG: helix-turn-helix domain-containing protein [Candidatus Puniceispirillaceae bacterium]
MLKQPSALTDDTFDDDIVALPDGASDALGADIRALRKGRGLTLESLADQLGKSVGFLSQVERGISTPSLEDLRAIAGIFDIPLSFFLSPHSSSPEEAGLILRASDRRMIGQEGDLSEELLSPDLSGAFEMLRSCFAAHARSADIVRRPTEESGFILSGCFELCIDGTWHHLEAGDSFRFKEAAIEWRNPGDEDCEILWVIAPPVY